MNQLLSTSELIKKYDLLPKKNLGQNFILDKNYTDKIAKSAGDLSNAVVLEIGGGPGSLSRSILDAGAKKLIIIEKDQRFINALLELKNFYGSRLEIINDDALTIDEINTLQQKLKVDSKIKIIANLPYNIGTELIFKWLKILPHIDSMNLMLQKEVVDRIVANVGSKNFGRLALMINLKCDSKLLFTVNREVFSPPPKIQSAIVSIIPNSNKLQKFSDEKTCQIYAEMIKIASMQRRKMIKSSLKNFFNKYIISEAEINNLLHQSFIDPHFRMQEISHEKFFSLAKFLNNFDLRTLS